MTIQSNTVSQTITTYTITPAYCNHVEFSLNPDRYGI